MELPTDRSTSTRLWTAGQRGLRQVENALRQKYQRDDDAEAGEQAVDVVPEPAIEGSEALAETQIEQVDKEQVVAGFGDGLLHLLLFVEVGWRIEALVERIEGLGWFGRRDQADDCQADEAGNSEMKSFDLVAAEPQRETMDEMK